MQIFKKYTYGCTMIDTMHCIPKSWDLHFIIDVGIPTNYNAQYIFQDKKAIRIISTRIKTTHTELHAK